jgi:hypothetical protein
MREDLSLPSDVPGGWALGAENRELANELAGTENVVVSDANGAGDSPLMAPRVSHSPHCVNRGDFRALSQFGGP